MSLEEAVRENTGAVLSLVELMKKLAENANSPKTSATTEDEPEPPKKRGPKPKAEKVEEPEPPKGPSAAEQLALDLKEWLGEFDDELFEVVDGKPQLKEGHDAKKAKKRDNRRAKIKACLDKVGKSNLKEITDEDAEKISKWIDEIKKTGKDPAEWSDDEGDEL